MPKQLLTFFLVCTAMLGFSPLVQAELTANVGVTTNYVFRGATQTDDNAAVQGGVDYTHELGIYAGVWGSNVEDAAGNDGFEYDLYAGYEFKASEEVKFDIGYITYQYTDDAFTDTDEIFIGASFFDFGITYYDGEPDSGSDYSYIDLKFTLPLAQEFNLHLHYGNLDSDTGDAEDASIGVSKEFKGFDTSLTWTTYDPDNGSDEDELFITVTKIFDLMK